MSNMPELKIGVVAVSRDCFPESLSVNRRKALIDAYIKKYGEGTVYECPICIVESEIHMVQALEDVKKAGCNALVVYLGNFGPEISETLLASRRSSILSNSVSISQWVTPLSRVNCSTKGWQVLSNAKWHTKPSA